MYPKTWYCGRINAACGRLAAKPAPERKVYQNLEIKGRKQYSAKVGFYPQVAMVFNGVPAGHPDEDALNIALALLNNNSQTGTMDKLVLRRKPAPFRVYQERRKESLESHPANRQRRIRGLEN